MKISDIDRQILRLALPSVATNVTVPLLGLCDTSISGHLGSGLYLAAIAVGTMAVNSVFWVLGFLRMGTTGLTAQAYGAADAEEQRLLFTRATLLALAAGCLLILLRAPLCSLIMSLIGPDKEVCNLASEYFRTIALGAPAMLCTMVASGWLLGMQTSVQPMVIAISTNALNILLSLLLAFGFKMGFIGTALGTVAAQWTGLLTALLLVWRFAGGSLPLAPLREVMQREGWGRFAGVNVYIFLRSLCIIAVTMAVTALGARLGTAVLAANVVIMQFFHIFSYFMDGFAFAGEALAGKAAGMRSRRMLRLTVRRLKAWGTGVTGLFLLIYIWWGTRLAGLITDDPATLSLIAAHGVWLWLPALCGAAAFIFDGIFIGLTATRSMLASTLLGLLGFTCAAHLLAGAGNDGLWTAFALYLALRGLYLGLRYRSAAQAALVK